MEVNAVAPLLLVDPEEKQLQTDNRATIVRTSIQNVVCMFNSRALTGARLFTGLMQKSEMGGSKSAWVPTQFDFLCLAPYGDFSNPMLG